MQPAELQTGAIPAKAFNIDRRLVTRAVPDAELTWLRARRASSRSGRQDGPARSTPARRSDARQLLGPPDGDRRQRGHAQRLHRPPRGAARAALGRHDRLHARRPRRPDRQPRLRARRASATASPTTSTSRRRIPATRLVERDRRGAAHPSRSLRTMLHSSRSTRPASSCETRRSPAPTPQGPSRASSRRAMLQLPSCAGASPISVLSPVGGVRIGTPGLAQGQEGFVPGDRGDALVIMQAPGEIFSSISLTTKDYLSRARNVMVFGMANDHIGYIIPAEQYDIRGANAAGIAQPQLEHDELRGVAQHRSLHRRSDPERAHRDRHESRRPRQRRGPLAPPHCQIFRPDVDFRRLPGRFRLGIGQMAFVSRIVMAM